MEVYYFILDIVLIGLGLGNKTNRDNSYIVYPLWKSFSVIEVKKFDPNVIQWLSYWVILALLTKLEALLFTILPLYNHLSYLTYFRFFIYRLVKMAFLLWMVHPDTLVT